jgi:hypothetical protein
LTEFTRHHCQWTKLGTASDPEKNRFRLLLLDSFSIDLLRYGNFGSGLFGQGGKNTLYFNPLQSVLKYYPVREDY